MKPESREHFERAEEFLAAAEVLRTNRLYSVALGRAYYAMFHAATAVLLERGIERSSHHGVIAAFGQFVVKSGHLPDSFHAYLQDAFDARGDSDYGSSPSVSADEAQTHIKRAREFVEACRRISD